MATRTACSPDRAEQVGRRATTPARLRRQQGATGRSDRGRAGSEETGCRRGRRTPSRRSPLRDHRCYLAAARRRCSGHGKVPPRELQLVKVAAILIVCKYEEIGVPEVWTPKSMIRPGAHNWSLLITG